MCMKRGNNPDHQRKEICGPAFTLIKNFDKRTIDFIILNIKKANKHFLFYFEKKKKFDHTY